MGLAPDAEGIASIPQLVAALVHQLSAELEPLKGWLSRGNMVAHDPVHTQQRWWTDQAATARNQILHANAAGRDVVRLD